MRSPSPPRFVAPLLFAIAISVSSAAGEPASIPPTDKPATQKELIDAVDFRKFPMLDSDKIYSRSAAEVSYEARETDVEKAMAFYRKELTAAGWKPAEEKVDRALPGITSEWTRQGISLGLNIFKNPSDRKIIISATNAGNIDARTLPRFGDAQPARASFAHTEYQTAAKLDDVVNFTRDEMLRRGWRLTSAPGGREPMRKAGKKDTLRFIGRGIGVTAYLEVKDGKSETAWRVRVLKDEMPLMPGILGPVEYIEEPLRCFYLVQARPDAVQEYFIREMPFLGWKRREGDGKNADGSTRAFWDSPGREPLYIDLLADRDGDTAVLIARDATAK